MLLGVFVNNRPMILKVKVGSSHHQFGNTAYGCTNLGKQFTRVARSTTCKANCCCRASNSGDRPVSGLNRCTLDLSEPLTQRKPNKEAIAYATHSLHDLRVYANLSPTCAKERKNILTEKVAKLAILV
jgi:hypothetical protein